MALEEEEMKLDMEKINSDSSDQNFHRVKSEKSE